MKSYSSQHSSHLSDDLSPSHADDFDHDESSPHAAQSPLDCAAEYEAEFQDAPACQPQARPRPSLLRMMLQALGIVGGLLALAAVFAMPSIAFRRSRRAATRAKPARRGGHRRKRHPQEAALLDEASTFAALREAIFGQSKRQIASVLGPPAAAGRYAKLPHCSANSGPQVASGAAALREFWNADTWYYPFNRHQRSAIALRFSHDRLARVDYIGRVS